MIVENRPGAGGQIATQDVLSKPRDGYNLLLCTHFESINAAVYKKKKGLRVRVWVILGHFRALATCT